MATYTILQIDRMPADEYARKLRSEPGFAQEVDRLEKQRREAAVRRGTLDSLGMPGNQ